MAFGQAAGPPATGRQVRRLEELLAEAGHVDFRDARGPLGLNQRQAAGRFTRDEADALIERMEADAEGGPGGVSVAPPPARLSRADSRLRDIADADLAAELQRRGWIVVEP